MKGIEPSIERLLAELGSDKNSPRGAEEAIRNAIAKSPYLNHLLANAIDDGKIGRLAISHGQHNGGHFQDATKDSPPTIFISASNFEDRKGDLLEERLTEVLGHETMHGVLSKERNDALSKFNSAYAEELTAAHDSRSESIDLTEPVRRILDSGRQHEALSEISGLRGLDSRLRNLNPSLNEIEAEKQLVEKSRSRCISDDGKHRALAEGVSYEALARRPNNEGVQLTKAVEQCFYDGKGTLGQHGDSDYRNYYGTYPLSVIGTGHSFLAEDRKAPAIRIDLKELGLDPKQLERNGLDLGSAKELAVGDFGKDGLGWVHLKNTGSASIASPPIVEPIQPPTAATALGAADQRLLGQIRSKVELLDKAHGRAFDETSERISASLLVAAKEAGISQADHVVLSKQTAHAPAAHTIFVIQGEISAPTAVRAHLPTTEAAQRSVQESMSRLESLGQRQPQEQALEMQRQQEQQQRGAVPSI